MRQLTKEELDARNEAFNNHLDWDDYEVIFNAAFIAGLDHQQAQIDALVEASRNLLAYVERQADEPPGAIREPMAVKQMRAALASVEGGAK